MGLNEEFHQDSTNLLHFHRNTNMSEDSTESIYPSVSTSSVGDNGSTSVVSEDVSNISLLSDENREHYVATNNIHEDSQNETPEQQKNAWEDIIRQGEIDDEEKSDQNDACLFFLKEIDISSEILKSDPNEGNNENAENIQIDDDKIHEMEKTTALESSDPQNSLPNIIQNENVIQGETVMDNQSPILTNEDTEKIKSPFFSKQIEISGESSNSNPVQIPGDNVKNSAKSSTIKRESICSSSSVTITNIEKSGSLCSISSRESSAHEDYASNIRVVVRVRPLSVAEIQHGDKSCISYLSGGSIAVEGSNQCKSFTFNSVLPEQSTQEEVFQESGIRNLIDKALDGFSCTVFAFGPTGSGKTHTIIGPSEQGIEDMLDNQDLCGIIGRSFRYLFESADKRSSVQYIIKASFLEIYNEKVKDLLNPSHAYDSLPVRWSAKKGFYVENLFSVECESSQDLMSLLVEGSNYRQVGVHAINEHSSRSHAIFTVYLESEEVDSDVEEVFPVIRHGKISFIDLAGSERVKETKATVDVMAESNNINKSLLVLGNCISALGDPKKRGYHIPYRDSKLTKLLADSLGGEGFTLMISCISPSSQTCQDTMNALRYANRAKDIKNKPVVKMDPKEQLLQRLKREIKLLRTENNYFREQQGVPCSESQIIITPNEIDGDLTPNFGVLSPAIGSDTLSSLQSSRNNSSKEIDMTPKNTLYTLGAKNGIYDILQEYMKENESLKAENMELHCSRAVAHREQEEMARENDRLARKLDELGRVMLNSPISRENVRHWINEGNDGDIIFTPSQGEHSASAKSKPENIKFPPVRQGSYPNYVTVDANSDYERESSRKGDEGPKKKVQANNEKKDTDDSEKSFHTNEKKSNTDVVIKLNTSKKISPSLKYTSMNASEKDNSPAINKDKKANPPGIEELNRDDKNEESSVKALSKKESIKGKKNNQQKPWKLKKKPATVEKPSGYAAQFAARKGLTSKQTTQHNENISNVTSDLNPYQTSQSGSIPYSSQPTPYYGSTQPNSYMNTPIYNYNPGYPYPSYVGMSPSQVSGGLSVAAYEQIANQLQQDLESLNGQLRKDVKYKQKDSKFPR